MLLSSPAAMSASSGANAVHPTNRSAVTQNTACRCSGVTPSRRARRMATSTVRSPFSIGSPLDTSAASDSAPMISASRIGPQSTPGRLRSGRSARALPALAQRGHVRWLAARAAGC